MGEDEQIQGAQTSQETPTQQDTQIQQSTSASSDAPAKRIGIPQIKNIRGLSRILNAYVVSQEYISPLIIKSLQNPESPVLFERKSKEDIIEITGIMAEVVVLSEQYIGLAEISESAHQTLCHISGNLDSRVDNIHKKRLLTPADYRLLKFDRKMLNKTLWDYVIGLDEKVASENNFEPIPDLADAIAYINQLIKYCISEPDIFNLKTGIERLTQKIDFFNGNFFPHYVPKNGADPSQEAARFVDVANTIFKPFYAAMKTDSEEVSVSFKVASMDSERRTIERGKTIYGFHRNQGRRCTD